MRDEGKMAGLGLRSESFYQLLHKALRVSAFARCYRTLIEIPISFALMPKSERFTSSPLRRLRF